MEFAGAFGATEEEVARGVGLGHVEWSWREKVGKQLSGREEGYWKSHRDQICCLVSEIAPCLIFYPAVEERAKSHSVVEKG